MNASENKGCIGVAMTQQLLLRCSSSLMNIRNTFTNFSVYSSRLG